MLFWTTLKLALRSLMANKLRSLLSMLGIIIGVGAVIAMLALGAGAQKQVLDQVTSMGANLMMIMPGQGMRAGVRSGNPQTLTLDDATAILENVEQIHMVSPVVRGNAQFKYYSNNTQSSVMGVSTTYFEIRNFNIDKGRTITSAEIDRRAKVAVLGADTVTELFEDIEPIGQEVKIGGIAFTVVGTLKSKGSMGPFSYDDLAIIPYTTAMNRVLGVDYLDEIDVQIEEGADQETVQADLETLLRKRHKMRQDEDDDFNVRNMAEMVETATSVTQTFTLLLGGVAGISLVVGGIGIMNIMLVTVTERTREIGIRKAIGAKDRDILVQFLLESILLSALGGLAGVGLGVGSALATTAISGFDTVIQPFSVILALSFAVTIGVFFGFYPARRAALLDPIDALSYE
ncbi:MAG: ABC transporter permease [Candidatus Hydrogenedentes bacterium]|nr:ABC transporter permease [Candidatus Hydrogenedentota bacterium]